MTRRTLLPAALGLLLLAAVPALADANGSTEERSGTRSCSAPADNHYSAPSSTDCRNSDGSYNGNGSYTATWYSNDVQCGSKNQVGPTAPNGVRVYASGDQGSQSGAAGTCSDGSGSVPAPIQGRATVGGSTSSGLTGTVDGDKDNTAHPKLAGWITVHEGAGAPTYRCGDAYAAGGRGDSEAPQDRDGTSSCG